MSGPLGAIIGRYPTVGRPEQEGRRTRDGSDGGGIIRHNRKCRDLVFLFIFIAFWVAMIVNSSFAFNQGNPLRLTYGLDYKGNVCGNRHGDPDLRELEVKYWMNPNQVYQSGFKNSHFRLGDARSVCLLECPTPSEDSLNWVCDYPEGDIRLTVDEWINRDYDYYEFLTPDMRNSSLQLQGPCYPVIFPSLNVLWSCQFIARASNASMRHWQQMGGVNIDENIIIDKTIHRAINSPSAVLKRYVADIGKTWPVLIVCGGILPLFLSVIWLLMIRYFVAGMTWITVSVFNILIIGVTMFFYTKGTESFTCSLHSHDNCDDCFRFIHNSNYPSHSYGNICFKALHLFSSGQILRNDCQDCCTYDLKINRVNCDSCCGYSIHYTPHISIAILFHLFGCYWATQFIIACSSTVIAGSVASYYWAHGEISQEIPFLPVFSSMKRLMRYSLGSVALGSLVVSIVESVRSMLESIRRRLKYTDSEALGPIGKVTSFSSKCCLGGIEWTIKSVNRNAYIMIAITGKSFCKASAIATGLIMNNILRIGKVNVIGDVILFLGKLCVSLFSAVFAFLMLDTHKYRSAHNKISSPLFPVLVCWGLGYVVSTLFFAVVEMAIDTIILSFCQDAEEHQGTAQYAPPLLIETLDGQEEMQRLTQGS
ncbi:hypothetical protein QJS04_geneDACA000496 [Acorus gramineus]|uniref:Choline transporter-like protein n=1 Tax=Acorus gramineus TaxID=55184 RepID=A0AAV9AQ33_ACOGR|nr:hypothetical protein QJS04_geneDACA000496 [Acorus gramineus]